ncbi:sedoheptulose 7-phosphate cyclase [cf. Phormidesmis sp. LEGE 11477]|uniref:sedoheptulose 7-phosphate cyclase n=1 Tax=cf. Phormidesmis sp. LEGE 11477 TaxID=1828680 RepID=UPI001880C850|nr:sedoheptulose 7-phosphate cyclase [cf. Phormidesmis sp. LEGE 11477]MBE9061106.1 sedoheptulose 7-phosphate cyclase [cf. Phormidesmis sp. LEGE 11477]
MTSSTAPMSVVSVFQGFIAHQKEKPLATTFNLRHDLEALFSTEVFNNLILTFVDSAAFSASLGKEFAAVEAIAGISACRRLRSCLNFSLGQFFMTLAELLYAFDTAIGERWYALANRVLQSELKDTKVLSFLLQGERKDFYIDLVGQLTESNPHAIYPTSCFRESAGFVESTADDQTVEAVVSTSTFTTVKIVDNTLNVENLLLRNIYISHGRCVCLIDQNVEQYYGERLEHYFAHHNIPLQKQVHRAMEVDKGIYTVEKMLGEFKQLGVSRNEPVLLVGGGVLADTGGLACALYHRNTPYVMLSTSIVAGVDAGPSPRTCCDGFGYKNLFGAYHPPILSITDRFFFSTLREGWLRHGIIEIIKMAVVKDLELFEYLEAAGPRLISTRFGTIDTQGDDTIDPLSQKILGGAIRSYVAAEYNNLYETHQCRPHAYGHTWSPGFEIEAGLLHGHAVAIGMGFGAYLSYRMSWISEAECHRIMKLISSFGLSLWHDVLNNKETLWASQQKIFQKRGQNLVAPLPKGKIGQCGYLNELSQQTLFQAIDEYASLCASYPRGGWGIEPHCSDVGLEDPSTVGQPLSSPLLSEQENSLEALSLA